MKLYFYGVLGTCDAGHYLYSSTGRTITSEPPRSGDVPFTTGELDGAWCQQVPWAFSEVSTRSHADAQVEGIAYVHNTRGWTILSWWDRSGDVRRGSCAVFLAEGVHTGAELLRLARERFSLELARMSRRYTIVLKEAE